MEPLESIRRKWDCCYNHLEASRNGAFLALPQCLVSAPVSLQEESCHYKLLKDLPLPIHRKSKCLCQMRLCSHNLLEMPNESQQASSEVDGFLFLIFQLSHHALLSGPTCLGLLGILLSLELLLQLLILCLLLLLLLRVLLLLLLLQVVCLLACKARASTLKGSLGYHE